MRAFLLVPWLVVCAACAEKTYEDDGDSASDGDADSDSDSDSDSDTGSDTATDTDPNAGVCCGEDCEPACALPEQECCFTGVTSCVASGTCEGTGVSACDGPEDCTDATCCWNRGVRVSSECADECPFECGSNMQRCHENADCPGAQPLCCFAPLPPTGHLGQCVDAACRAVLEDFFGGPAVCDE